MAQYRDAPTSAEQRTAQYKNWSEYEDTDQQKPDPYVDLIQRDPVVCDTCFLTRYDVLTCEWWRGSFGWSDFEYWLAKPGYSEEVPSDEPSRGVRLVCRNCGTKHEKLRPIPKHLIGEYTENLSTTLRAKGISHDSAVLFETVAELNTPENQGKQDTDVFKPAVKRAIRYADSSSAVTN